MRKILFAVVVLFLINLTLVSAEILLSQPKSVYNLGDVLEVKATIKPSQYISDFFELNLKCKELSKNIHREHLTLNLKDEKSISTSLSLTKSFLGDMIGSCSISSKFSQEQAESQKFILSDKIDVSLNLNNITIEPGKEILVKGSAVKENNGKATGFVEINIENTDIKITRTVSNGNFEAKFSFPENIRAGDYSLNARVYEKVQGEETNSGEAKITLSIKKKPSKIEIAISKQSAIPGEKLVFIPVIYDQANEEVVGEISIKIYNPFDKVFFQKIIKSGEEEELYIDYNQSFGYWRINAESLGLEAKRLFYVEELEKVSFEISNDALIITNMGNIVYRKAIQISIGEVVEIKNINLDVGEKKKLRLTGDGRYNIRVTDGVEELFVEGVSLTGQVVGVKDVGGKISLITRYPIVWLFLIAVLGLFIIILVQRVVKKKFYVAPVAKKEKFLEKAKEKDVKGLKEKLIVPTPSRVDRAEHSLVLHGRKEDSGILVIRVEDLKNVRKACADTLNNLIKTIVENKGVVYETSDYLIGIFSSPTTRTFENDILALKVSKQANEILKEHNRKFREKIDYGIAVNSGELILKKEPNKIKFTTIGSTINLGRKISELAKGEVLLSENLQKRLASQLRADKEVRQGINVYHIKSIVDRDKNKKFISDFLNRLNKESKKKET